MRCKRAPESTELKLYVVGRSTLYIYSSNSKRICYSRTLSRCRVFGHCTYLLSRSRRRLCYQDRASCSSPKESSLIQLELFNGLFCGVAGKSMRLIASTYAAHNSRLARLTRPLDPALSFLSTIDYLIRNHEAETRGRNAIIEMQTRAPF